MRNPRNTSRLQAALISGVLLVIGAVATVQSFVFSAMRGQETTWFSVARWQFPLWMVWAALAPLVLALGRRVPITKPRLGRAVILHIVAGVCIALLHTVVLALITVTTSSEWDVTITQAFLGAWGSQFHLLVLIYWTILGAGHALNYYQRFRERELAASQLETQLLAARLETLKRQLHPHFLFNTLQNILVLIQDDPKLAKRTVARLGDLLRWSTDSVSVQEVTLARELEFLHLYLEIERTRFQDRLNITVDVPDGLHDALVPSFVFQPIVENCIKHGVSKHAGAAWIKVAVTRVDDDLILVVENSNEHGPVVAPETWKDGVGLATTKERLQALYNGKHHVEIAANNGAVQVALRVPYHTELTAR